VSAFADISNLGFLFASGKADPLALSSFHSDSTFTICSHLLAAIIETG
jgi:hypothetical protein